MARRILIVEDEAPIRQLLSAIFADTTSYDVASAVDGEEALKMARRHKPDIVLLDVLLPKMNGYEVCKSLKSDPATAHIKVLMLTGMVQNADQHRAREMGADAYMAKPFHSTELIEKVTELLGNKAVG
ncbi:MAG: response regulator [Chloroflexi bacterium]|nr:response regulator [Chloroflexota bacterium]